MKRFLLSVVLATTLALTSCQFDDSDIWGKLDEYGESIRDHEQRISALEELCKQMNTNIEALQTLVEALEKRDYVTNVSEVRSNGEVIGYTISFAYSDTITIYHGKDGANGADGKDGYTPQIGVMKDTDGIYYWTLDGEWLLDGKGNKIQANGVNGTDGTNGSNGTNGTNGVTPQLKIENDYWYVSYDNGVSWQQLGKATGEDGTDGNDGIDGEDGDSIFKSVTQDDEYVYFNLSDGTMITLPKHDKENIQFEDLQVKAICCKNWDTNNDGELSFIEASSVKSIGDVFSENTSIIAFAEFKYFTGVTSLSSKSFYRCTNLWKIELPENITEIKAGSVNGGSTNGFEGYGAFLRTSITNIKLPKKLLSIGNGAFANCESLKIVDLGNSEIMTIDSYAFWGCSGLTSITISNSVTSIGSHAFFYCTSLTSVTIPDSVTSIGEYAFAACDNLATMEIGDGIVTIPSGMSQNCPLLTNVIIGKNVKVINYEAFGSCNRLTHIYCKPTTPPQIYYSKYGGRSFTEVAGMKIYVPRESYEEYIKYSSTKDQSTTADNWCLYKSYIQPFDF